MNSLISSGDVFGPRFARSCLAPPFQNGRDDSYLFLGIPMPHGKLVSLPPPPTFCGLGSPERAHPNVLFTSWNVFRPEPLLSLNFSMLKKNFFFYIRGLLRGHACPNQWTELGVSLGCSGLKYKCGRTESKAKRVSHFPQLQSVCRPAAT